MRFPHLKTKKAKLKNKKPVLELFQQPKKFWRSAQNFFAGYIYKLLETYKPTTA